MYNISKEDRMPLLDHPAILLVFAHRGEAQAFLKGRNFRAVDFAFSGVFQSEKEMLLLCGEGLPAAQQRVAAFLNAFGKNLSRVVNLGIAGSLSDSLKPGEIYPIRTVYREPEGGPAFPSFRSAEPEAQTDCVSAAKRVLTRGYAQRLAPFAPIVDRELWAIASLCADYNLPFLAYKLISDRAGVDTSTVDFKACARQFSEQLYKFYLLHRRNAPEPYR